MHLAKSDTKSTEKNPNFCTECHQPIYWSFRTKMWLHLYG